MTLTIDELLVLLAFEARMIELADVCAALGLPRAEAVALEFRAIDEGTQLARRLAAGAGDGDKERAA